MTGQAEVHSCYWYALCTSIQLPKGSKKQMTPYTKCCVRKHIICIATVSGNCPCNMQTITQAAIMCLDNSWQLPLNGYMVSGQLVVGSDSVTHGAVL